MKIPTFGLFSESYRSLDFLERSYPSGQELVPAHDSAELPKRKGGNAVLCGRVAV